jgi:mono/diheme cytochrome c family protein
MRLTLAALVVVAACGQRQTAAPPPVDAPGAPDAEPMPAVTPAARLPAIEGASAGAGKAIFADRCAGCHGADGKGGGPDAAKLRLAPTNLTTAGYLCRTTFGRPVAVPADGDVETAIDRGSHRAMKALAQLKPVERRSLTLYLKSLAPDFNLSPEGVLEPPPETPDDAESRSRGRTLYLVFGCWRCHGVDGKGGGDALPTLRWNGRPVATIPSLQARDQYLCGSDPLSLFRVIHLGLGSPASIMPAYGDFAEQMGRPDKVGEEEWTRSLEGKASPADLEGVKAFYRAQPPLSEVRTQSRATRRKRSAGFVWDLVHYIRSI